MDDTQRRTGSAQRVPGENSPVDRSAAAGGNGKRPWRKPTVRALDLVAGTHTGGAPGPYETPFTWGNPPIS